MQSKSAQIRDESEQQSESDLSDYYTARAPFDLVILITCAVTLL